MDRTEEIYQRMQLGDLEQEDLKDPGFPEAKRKFARLLGLDPEISVDDLESQDLLYIKRPKSP